MAVSSINAIPTHVLANSYVTVAEADQYFSDRLAATDWTGASADDKARALLEATRRVDAFRFFNERYRRNPDQALQFPRNDVRTFAAGVDSASATTIVDDAFAGKADIYPDDYFIGWAIEFRSGAHKGTVVLVTDFAASTGTFTFATLGSAPSAGDSVAIIEKVPRNVKLACFEIAAWLLGGGEAEGDHDPSVKQHSIGNFSETFADGSGGEVRMPRKAYAYLQRFISRIGIVT